jgi:putative transposase
LPKGRRVQIDATRLSLADGFAWVHVVGDVASRVCRAACVGRSLSQERAAHTLHEGHHRMRQYGITTSLVIQSDADSTSEYFQRGCQVMGRG